VFVLPPNTRTHTHTHAHVHTQASTNFLAGQVQGLPSLPTHTHTLSPSLSLSLSLSLTLSHKYTHTHTYTQAPIHFLPVPSTRAAGLWGIYCNTLKRSATHCNTLQHTAAHQLVYGVQYYTYIQIYKHMYAFKCICIFM